MNELNCVDPRYSTTRRMTRTAPVPQTVPGSKFDRISRFPLPKASQRKNEGGLRLQGYFKARPDLNRDTANEDEIRSFPLITIITVVLNGGKTLEQTILSVINQSFNNVEYIIIDGGSKDASLDIVRKYEHAIDYWVSEPDGGIFDAWNKGVSLSSGEWIAFLGADDTYRGGAIQAYVDLINKYKNGNLEYISSKVNLVNAKKTLRVIGKQWNWKNFKKYMNVAHVGSLHHYSLFERQGGYDNTYKICGDYEFLLRFGSQLKAGYLNVTTVNMSVGGVSNNTSLALWEMARAKIETGKRNAFLSHSESIFAIIRWKVRKWIWY